MVFVHGSLPAAKTRRHVEVERHGILADERGGQGGGMQKAALQNAAPTALACQDHKVVRMSKFPFW